MTRMSKQGKRRNTFPRKRKNPFPKTGPKKDNLPNGFKEHQNALEESTPLSFIPKIS